MTSSTPSRFDYLESYFMVPLEVIFDTALAPARTFKELEQSVYALWVIRSALAGIAAISLGMVADRSNGYAKAFSDLFENIIPRNPKEAVKEKIFIRDIFTSQQLIRETLLTFNESSSGPVRIFELQPLWTELYTKLAIRLQIELSSLRDAINNSSLTDQEFDEYLEKLHAGPDHYPHVHNTEAFRILSSAFERSFDYRLLSVY